ncbi:MAG: N-6 DNA methylase [Verrucomicrobiales bacterium]|nr:N-6 DNA methylase [Verrucomicrobiales bacterium]
MINLAPVKSLLGRIGYQSSLFSENVRAWDSGFEIPLVAHSRAPKDIRTSAIAIIEDDGGNDRLNQAGLTGASLVFGIGEDHWRCGKFVTGGVELLYSGKLDTLEPYVDLHGSAFHPDAIYRAKTWGRLDPSVRQPDFVDYGWFPLVEKEVGARITTLLEDSVSELAAALGWSSLDESPGSRTKAEWLIQAPFWLLAAKTLQDKRVERFRRLDLEDFDTVFSRLASHYKSDDAQPLHVPKNRQKALTAVAQRIGRFASLELMSTEALGHVYESALINKATRKRLGTHCTPVWLIDYVIGRLRPWIIDMPVAERSVFEPGCGHAGFLVGALRLLDELRPHDYHEPREKYLRKRLHGVDVDPFSQEVARLALTLADVPNPNGWWIVQANMFETDIIERESSAANIVLANPPFESFLEEKMPGFLPNKAAETLSRVVHNLPIGGILAFVLPQSVLKSSHGKTLRERLLRDYEMPEITLFADKVFQFGQPESAVVIARRHGQKSRQYHVGFCRVRENDVSRFADSFSTFAREQVSNEQLLTEEGGRLFVPELLEVWRHLRKLDSELRDYAHVGKGFDHEAQDALPKGTERFDSVEFPGAVEGFANWTGSPFTHQLPNLIWLNLSDDVVQAKRSGIEIGKPQVIFNYARVSREAWRIKALIDDKGHPFTSRFVVVRPTSKTVSLNVLWGILNSPIANAFAFSHLTKRDNLVGEMRKMPVPDLSAVDLQSLERAVVSYLSAVRHSAKASSALADRDKNPLFYQGEHSSVNKPVLSEDELRLLHWNVDAEVMKLYSLPPELERKVIMMFSGVERRGVPFVQTEYFPARIKGINTLVDLVHIHNDWDRYAARKTDLVEKKVAQTATPSELKELAELKRLSGARLDLLHPLPIDKLKSVRDELKRKLADTQI